MLAGANNSNGATRFLPLRTHRSLGDKLALQLSTLAGMQSLALALDLEEVGGAAAASVLTKQVLQLHPCIAQLRLKGSDALMAVVQLRLVGARGGH
jgi:hypothetical protein